MVSDSRPALTGVYKLFESHITLGHIFVGKLGHSAGGSDDKVVLLHKSFEPFTQSPKVGQALLPCKLARVALHSRPSHSITLIARSSMIQSMSKSSLSLESAGFQPAPGQRCLWWRSSSTAAFSIVFLFFLQIRTEASGRPYVLATCSSADELQSSSLSTRFLTEKV